MSGCGLKAQKSHPSIPSHAMDWLSTKEIKMSQKDINWKIIGAQDVLATKIKSYQKPVSVVILWLGHEIEILFSFFQTSSPDYKIKHLETGRPSMEEASMKTKALLRL